MDEVNFITHERFGRIRTHLEKSKIYFQAHIQKPEVREKLFALMLEVDQVAQRVIDTFTKLKSDVPSEKLELQKLLRPEISQLANQILQEMQKIRAAEEPYTQLEDRREAYADLSLLYEEHLPKPTDKLETTWQENAMWIEQQLMPQEALKALLKAIYELSKNAGLSQNRKIYLCYTLPSSELAHEQWTVSFLEKLREEMSQAGLIVSTRQMGQQRLFQADDADLMLVMGSRSLLKAYEQRDPEMTEQMRVAMKRLVHERRKLDLSVIAFLLSGEQETSLPAPFQLEGVVDLAGTQTERKSYSFFLKSLLQELCQVPHSKEHPDRIAWEKLWLVFRESIDSFLFDRGLHQAAVEQYIKQHRLDLEVLEAHYKEATLNSLRMLGLTESKASQPMTRPRIQMPASLARFIGREQEISQLSLLTYKKELLANASIVILHGGGGVGKSELAIKFATDCQAKFSFVYWFKAATDEQMHLGYRELAAFLNLYIEGNTHEIIVQRVNMRLEEATIPWLLIFDNLETSFSLPARGGAVLVTSRKKHFWKELEEVIEIRPFGFEDACKLFGNPTQNLDSYQKLFGKLEGIPLLLTQANQFLQEGCTVDEYLQMMEQESPLWEKTDRYPQALGQTYALTFQKVERTSTVALHFLKVCSFLQPDRIHKRLLGDWLELQGSPSLAAAIKIRSLLSEWSLLRIEGEDLKMHRFLQVAVKKIYEEEQPELFAETLSLIEHNLYKFDEDIPLSWNFGEMSIIHAEVVSQNPLWNTKVERERQAKIYIFCGDYCELIAEYQKTLEYQKKALEIRREVLGEKHPDTVESYNLVGISYGKLGDYKKALEFEEKALDIRKEVLGEKHSDTASSYNNVGITYRELGDYKRGLENQEKALEIRKEVLGAKHSSVASSYDNVGAAYAEKGDYQKALEYEEKALAMRIEVLGEKHPDTASSYDNVGITYGELGNNKKALEYKLKALEIRKEVFGEKHPDTAASYNNIGATYEKLEEFEKALEYMLKALEIRKEVLGEKHPDTLTCYSNLSTIYSELEDSEKALEYEEKALAMRIEVLGEMHPDTAWSYNSAGVTYQELGDFEKGMQHQEKALEIRRKVLGEKHPDTATSYYNLGEVYGEQEDHEKALEYEMKSLEIRRKIYGENHPDTAKSYINMGMTYDDLDDYKKALECQEKALEIRRKIFGEKHSDTATSYMNVGKVYGDLGNHEKALEYEKKALEIRLEVHGEKHPDVAMSYNNLGVTYGDLGVRKKELKYKKKALRIRREVLGEKHLDTARSYNNLGMTYEELGDFKKASECLEKALDIKREVLGEEHLDTADSYNNFGWAMITLGKYKKAIRACKKGLRIYKMEFEEDYDEKSYFILDSIALAYAKLHLYEKALKHQKKALEHAKISKQDIQLIDYFARLAFIQQKLGQPEARKTSLKVLSVVHPSNIEMDEKIASLYNNHGLILVLQGERQGLKFIQEALEFRRTLQRKSRVELAESLYTLGCAHRHLLENEKAIDALQQALDIQQKEMDENHPEAAETLQELALVHETLDQPEKALKLHEQALSTRLKSLGLGCIPTAESYHCLGKLLAKLGRHSESIEHLQKAVVMACAVYQKSHPMILTCLQGLLDEINQVDDQDLLHRVHTAVRTPCVQILGEQHPLVQELDAKSLREGCSVM